MGKDISSNQLSYGLGECATNLASNEHGLEATHTDVVSSLEMSREGNRGDQVPTGSENIAITSNGVELLAENNGSRRRLLKEEVC